MNQPRLIEAPFLSDEDCEELLNQAPMLPANETEDFRVKEPTTELNPLDTEEN